jgi:hypothetical protein
MAAKWQGFKRYLETIDRFEQLSAARQIFEPYLPYAVAFGLEKDWIEKFSRVMTPAPGWYAPYGHVYLPGGSGSGSGGSGGSGGTGGLQGMSDRGSGLLQGSSDSLVALFHTGGQAFGAGSGAGSGGVGGGFGGGGFGGGGGGGGFS